MSEQNQNQSSPAPAPSPEVSTSTRANIVIPTETFEVEEGLPTLATGGRQGQSKYSPLLETAKALKVNSHFKVPLNGTPKDAFIRNVRLAIKKANLTGIKVTAVVPESGGEVTQVAIFRTA